MLPEKDVHDLGVGVERAVRLEVRLRDREQASALGHERLLDLHQEHRHDGPRELRERGAEHAQELETRLLAEECDRALEGGEEDDVGVGERRVVGVDGAKTHRASHLLDPLDGDPDLLRHVADPEATPRADDPVADEPGQPPAASAVDDLVEREPLFQEPLEECEAVGGVGRVGVVQAREFPRFGAHGRET